MATTLLVDGLHNTISFLLANFTLECKELTVPGYDSRGGVDTTTLNNVSYVTMLPKLLKKQTDVSGVAVYNPTKLSTAASKVGITDYVTITFNDGSTFSFWGWLDKFTPNAMKEGEQPTVNFTVICGHQNPTTFAEQGPTFVAG